MRRVLNCLAALLTAALVPAIAFILICGLIALCFGSNFIDLLNLSKIMSLGVIVLLFTLPHTLLLGMPVIIILDRYNLISCKSSIISGFLIGALPINMIANPLKTSNILSILSIGLVFGLFGAIGGLSAWFVLRRTLIKTSLADV